MFPQYIPKVSFDIFEEFPQIIGSGTNLCTILNVFTFQQMQHSVGVEDDNVYYCACKESQHRLGWKGPLEIILSNRPARGGSVRASGPGLCPVRFLIPPRVETSPPPWATCCRV